jgi:histidinol phosphatase-like enzyme
MFVVSNQPEIGRGYFDERAIETLHRHVQGEFLAYGTSIDAF